MLQLSASETAEMEISIYFTQLTASSTEYIFYIACFSINVERKACQWIFFSEIAKFTRKSSMHRFLFTMTMFQFFSTSVSIWLNLFNILFNILHFIIVQLLFFWHAIIYGKSCSCIIVCHSHRIEKLFQICFSFFFTHLALSFFENRFSNYFC